MAIKRPDRRLFNVTADENVIKRLKTYCLSTDSKICSVFEAAMTDYLNKKDAPKYTGKLVFSVDSK